MRFYFYKIKNAFLFKK